MGIDDGQTSYQARDSGAARCLPPREIPIDDVSEADLGRADEAQRELIEEFDRRAGDAKYSPDWKS
ncbi:hypothetical protein BED46_026650 [Burkholderia contaminans]|jgi:hypothetical protein|uniref:Uncharacterized protein n=2 Tax=Burkholderia contaminans TaxID=488447 RepID=A0A286P6L8_9BURK|nr:hypothetical protein WR31_24520 [Burkholderia contaminans LMG 23361]MBA9830939.1 hypothetical protein [Burkholderia contaminans]MBA9839001.1 hypothetical protein [Burkholderia contaminans]MBA9864310.1 hypothetical protein [Burkholderia contaminans]MBA9906579.1 hypothetical protein [Burkholderia contaminans]